MTKFGYTYDYTKTMMMKLKMSEPNRKGGTTVMLNCSQALELIKTVNAMTLGAPKIIYLVGWQYLGHDDKYPDFFEANSALKRAEDKTANDSILWLMSEAKQYNTIVSFHINFTDAYEDAPSFNDYVASNALIRKKSGKIHAIENYNGKKCYKICYKTAWESGLFKRQVDKLLSIFPLEELGTVHVDNFQCYGNYNPNVSILEQSAAREKMIDYLRAKNIDITSEFTYRENNSLPNKMYLGLPRDHKPCFPMHTLGKIPAVWWLTYLSDKELIDIEPQQFSGGILRNGIRNDARKDFIYGNMHGEDIFLKMNDGKSDWAKLFINEYATMQLPYNYLCRHKRLSLNGKKGDYKCNYQGDICSSQCGGVITCQGYCIKDGDNLCLPLSHIENAYFAYSAVGDKRTWKLVDATTSQAKLYEITPIGKKYIGAANIKDGNIVLDIQPQQAIYIELVTTI